MHLDGYLMPTWYLLKELQSIAAFVTFYRANRAVFFLKIETNFGKKHLRYLGSKIILWEVPPLQFYYVVILSYVDDVCVRM